MAFIFFLISKTHRFYSDFWKVDLWTPPSLNLRKYLFM